MYRKFCDYLSEEFKKLPSTKEINDFKDELLGNLMDKMAECEGKGMTDEEIIFNTCISSIDGYKDTLKVLRGHPLLVKGVKSAATIALYFIAYIFVVIGVYLAVSFTGSLGWAKSWIIIVDGLFLGEIVLFILLIMKAYKAKKINIGRSLMIPITLLLVIGAYLSLSVFTGAWAKTWLIMPYLPVVLLLVDIIMGQINGKNKIIVPELIILVLLSCVMGYITLGILAILPWHPYWLIIVSGILIDTVIIALSIKLKK